MPYVPNCTSFQKSAAIRRGTDPLRRQIRGIAVRATARQGGSLIYHPVTAVRRTLKSPAQTFYPLTKAEKSLYYPISSLTSTTARYAPCLSDLYLIQQSTYWTQPFMTPLRKREIHHKSVKGAKRSKFSLRNSYPLNKPGRN